MRIRVGAPPYRGDVPSGVVVEQVLAPVTYPLRRAVLRPHLTAADGWDAVAFPGDNAPDAAHFAAYALPPAPDAHLVVGVVGVLPEPARDGRQGWRLRGMAVDPGRRGSGVGAALTSRVVEHVARLAPPGGALLWCLSREVAVGFYARQGFAPDGEWEDVPQIGPHLPMSRHVEPWARPG